MQGAHAIYNFAIQQWNSWTILMMAHAGLYNYLYITQNPTRPYINYNFHYSSTNQKLVICSVEEDSLDSSKDCIRYFCMLHKWWQVYSSILLDMCHVLIYFSIFLNIYYVFQHTSGYFLCILQYISGYLLCILQYISGYLLCISVYFWIVTMYISTLQYTSGYLLCQYIVTYSYVCKYVCIYTDE